MYRREALPHHGGLAAVTAKLDRSLAWVIAGAATLTMTVSYIDRQMLAALADTVTRELDFTRAAYGWLGAAFSFAYLIATPLAGMWIDRIGARRGLVISVVVWSAVAALHALVPSFAALFALRIALGVAESPSFPGAAQTVQRVLPPEDRHRGFGVLFTGSSIGGLIAPPLASLLFAWQGWRMAFVTSAVVGLVWLPLWIAVTSLPRARAVLDVEARRVARSLSIGALIREPAMIRALAAIFSAAPVIGFMLLWGPKYLAEVHHVEQVDVGHYAWLPPLAFDIGAIGFGHFASQLRDRERAVRGLFAIGCLLALVVAALPIAGGPWGAVAMLSVAVAGGGALYTIATADLMGRVPADCVSTASGVLAGAQSLMMIVMNPLIGAVVDYTGNYVGVVAVIGAITIPGSLVWLLWRLPKSATASPAP